MSGSSKPKLIPFNQKQKSISNVSKYKVWQKCHNTAEVCDFSIILRTLVRTMQRTCATLEISNVFCYILWHNSKNSWQLRLNRKNRCRHSRYFDTAWLSGGLDNFMIICWYVCPLHKESVFTTIFHWKSARIRGKVRMIYFFTNPAIFTVGGVSSPK